MTRSLHTLLIIAVVAAVFSVSQQASAQYGFGPTPFAAARGFYPNYYVDQRPPYFAQFPPVYYKAPIIARHYGQSPFPYSAHGCGCTTAVEEMKPAVLRNPFVKPTKDEAAEISEASSKSSRTPEPVMILNPHVNAGVREASTAGGRSPQTVYPMAMFSART